MLVEGGVAHDNANAPNLSRLMTPNTSVCGGQVVLKALNGGHGGVGLLDADHVASAKEAVEVRVLELGTGSVRRKKNLRVPGGNVDRAGVREVCDGGRWRSRVGGRGGGEGRRSEGRRHEDRSNEGRGETARIERATAEVRTGLRRARGKRNGTARRREREGKRGPGRERRRAGKKRINRAGAITVQSVGVPIIRRA